MGFLTRLFTGDDLVPVVTNDAVPVITDVGTGPQFEGVSIDDGVLYGVPAGTPIQFRRLNRRAALSVPAVKSARDLIANAVGGLVMRLHDSAGTVTDWPLLDQPEEGVAGSITWTNVAEDLLFDGRAWLAPTHVGWHGKPVQVARLEPETVTAQPEYVVHYGDTGNGTALRWKPDTRLIRIDSPNAGLLDVGFRAIHTLIALAEATDQATSALPPMAYFRPADGETDPADDDDVQETLDSWEAARAKRRTAYVPLALKLEALGWNPEQLQLPELWEKAVLEIARLTRVDPEELGVSTTSRTYFNAFDRKQNFIEFGLKGYLKAISGRLSMDDVTPRGYKVRHDLDEFFQSDTLSRYQAYEVGKRVGAITEDEIRDAEGRPPLTASERAVERALPDSTESQPSKEISA